MTHRVLRRLYPASARSSFYEAAQLLGCEPIVRRIRLSQLSDQTVSTLARLYVPRPGVASAGSNHRAVAH